VEPLTSGPLPSFETGRSPRISFGAGGLARVGSIVARHGTRALLVLGGRSFRGSPRRAELDTILAEAGVTLVGELSVTGEPSPTVIEEALERFRRSDVDVVVAIGGGSTLDTGKAMAGLLESGTSLLDHLEGVGRGLPYRGPAVPMVALPTTAGTGSEATKNAVFSKRGAGGYKRSFRDDRLMPADAVIDPELLAGAPQALIAANGLDALTQLIEAFTSQRASPLTDALARSGLAAAKRGLLAWHADPDGVDAAGPRSDMAYAALLSGICLANAGLGAVHGLASPLGALLPIPHGMACGAVLWQTLDMNMRTLSQNDSAAPALRRYAELGRMLGDAPEATDEDARGLLVETLRTWVDRLGAPGLGTFGMVATDIPTVVADSAGSSMRTNPIALSDDALTEILSKAL
jgi:alcohol dehydrogenase